MSQRYSLSDLATVSGLPARTIRYYISRGILHRPVCPGRDAFYEDSHVQALSQIRTWTKEGLTLADIHLRLHPETSLAPKPETWLHHSLGENVLLCIRGDVTKEELRTLLTRYVQENL